MLFTWQLIQKLGPNYGSYGQGGVPNLVSRVIVLNQAQFEITLSQTVNSNWFELNGLVQLVPLPRHAWGDLTADQLWEDQSQPQFFGVVDGPFKLYDFAMGRSISFVPNPSYPLQRSPFQRLVIKFVQSSGAEIQGIASGELDEANLPHEAFDAGALVPNSHLVTLPPNATYDFIGFNFNNPAVPFFKDPLVRQAIQDSVDQKTMIAKLWHGQGVEVYGPVPAQPPTYLSPAARAGHYPIGFDLKRAAALLDQAGYKPGPDGIRAKNGIRLEFTVIVLSGTATSLMMAQMIQPYLRQTGIAMHIEMMDYGQLLATVEQKIAPWQAYILEADLTAYPSGETNFSTGAFQNFGGYSDPKMDRLITDSTTQPGLDALYQYQDYTSEQVPVIFLPNPRPIELERNGISGIDRVISPGNQYNPQLIIFNREACHAAHVIHAR